MSNKYLITGATGFIGSHLVEYLLKDGVPLKDMRLLVLPGDSLKNLPDKKFDIFYGDIRNKKDVKKALQGISVVYHLAAKTVFEGKTYNDFKDTNVDGTKNLIDFSVKAKVSKFIFFSSIAVYGLPAFVGEIINWSESRTKKPAEVYGKSKLEAEKIVVSAYQENKLHTVIVRPTTVYGPRDHQGVVELYNVIDKGMFVRVGDGKNKVDYVYVSDLVKGARLAEKKASSGADYILGGGNPITFNHLVNRVGLSIGKKISNFYIPKYIALAISYLFDFVGRQFGVKSPIFPQRVRVMTTNCYFNIDKARKEIGYKPSYDFAKGAFLTAEWYKNIEK